MENINLFIYFGLRHISQIQKKLKLEKIIYLFILDLGEFSKIKKVTSWKILIYLFILYLEEFSNGADIPNLRMYGSLDFIMTDTEVGNQPVLIHQPPNHKAVLSTNHAPGFGTLACNDRAKYRAEVGLSHI